MKLGNSSGGKGPWFKTDATSGKGQEIGQPINSDYRSETADGVTRESEVRSWVSLLRLHHNQRDAPGIVISGTACGDWHSPLCLPTVSVSNEHQLVIERASISHRCV